MASQSDDCKHARLCSVLARHVTGRTKHYRGLPPELTDGVDGREALGGAAYLIIATESSGIFLYRFDEQGDCVGDTWHRSLQEAKDQALYEYVDALGAWIEVPSEVADAPAFGLERLRQIRDG